MTNVISCANVTPMSEQTDKHTITLSTQSDDIEMTRVMCGMS